MTDATDDFDFVTVNSETGIDQLTFTALDGQIRTDYWLWNDLEITKRDRVLDRPKLYRMDAWDPDTDDDGLTDGQEIDGITVRDGGAPAIYPTDPTDPDSDSDGYWDGWAGVSVDTDRRDVPRTPDTAIARRPGIFVTL